LTLSRWTISVTGPYSSAFLTGEVPQQERERFHPGLDVLDPDERIRGVSAAPGLSEEE
jgi:hypothetical protein